MNTPRDFNELVSWACWEIIKGITSGQSLSRTVHHVLAYARSWAPANKEADHG